MEARHTPVMVQEVLTALQVRSDGRYVDCTVGEGGHSEAILRAVAPPPGLLGIDLDEGSLAVAKRRLSLVADTAATVKGSYADLGSLAREHGFLGAAGIFWDLGMSSRQLEEDERGFSFVRRARLDMRFDTAQPLTAYEVVNRFSEQELVEVLREYGEERRAPRVARAIVDSRPVELTTDLAEVVARALGGRRRGRIHPATRTFQAIRIAVNDELENVRRGIEQAIEVLAVEGRLAVISYHSLEDRIVKTALKRESTGCLCPPDAPQCVCGHRATLKLVTRRVTKPSHEEITTNPRSRSAKLRVAQRI